MATLEVDAMKTLLLILSAAFICFSTHAASNARSGVWTAELHDDGELQTTFFHGHDAEHRNNNMMSTGLPLASFAGLTRADITSSAANVRFTMARAAGTLEFEGRFANGIGAGNYHFTPSEPFNREMDSLGYRDFTDDELLVFTVHDLRPQTIRELRELGYNPTKHEVVEIAIFGVTAERVREYSRLGYPNLALHQLVELRIFRVDAAYINGLRDAGLTNLAAHELTELAIGHVTPARIAEYRRAGYDHLTAKQLSQFGIFHITPEYIAELAKAGYEHLPADKLITLKVTKADELLKGTRTGD